MFLVSRIFSIRSLFPCVMSLQYAYKLGKVHGDHPFQLLFLVTATVFGAKTCSEGNKHFCR